MTYEELALSMRPRHFDEMIGSKKVIREIRKLVDSNRIPKAWMLFGETGCGKTTIAEIMAVSFQCRHQKRFGHPCRACRKKKFKFDIVDINASDQTGKKEIGDIISGYNYHPKPGSLNRVYILNEAHKLSDSAQNLLLVPTEKCPKTTKFIICTTKPDAIINTLQRRCTMLAIPSLDLDGVKELVKRGLDECKSDRSVGDLAEKLLENRITSPGIILKAVQKYADDIEVTADEAAQVTLTNVDTYSICRSVIKGEWETVARVLQTAKPEDTTPIRLSVTGYLNAILLADTDFSNRTNVVMKSILELNHTGNDFSGMCAVLYKVCKYFRREKR